jgi:hypothetical protein
MEGSQWQSKIEKHAKLAQKLGQLQPFLAAFPQECMGQFAFLGQPNTFLARMAVPPSSGSHPGGR